MFIDCSCCNIGIIYYRPRHLTSDVNARPICTSREEPKKKMKIMEGRSREMKLIWSSSATRKSMKLVKVNFATMQN